MSRSSASTLAAVAAPELAVERVAAEINATPGVNRSYLRENRRWAAPSVSAPWPVPEPRFDAVAAQVNAFDEVAHNYARTHRLNMWFVLATETPEAIARTAEAIEAATGLRVLRFPKLVEFCVGFRVAA